VVFWEATLFLIRLDSICVLKFSKGDAGGIFHSRALTVVLYSGKSGAKRGCFAKFFSSESSF